MGLSLSIAMMEQAGLVYTFPLMPTLNCLKKMVFLMSMDF
jgi:hypothetical protein